ncbi:MAG: vitamin K-dependent gamma-carboxylase [Hyphomicrobiaceae bacterium]|jgi:vitamin K-dependent gamma-carboxylase
MSWAGLLFDLRIGFALWNRRSRRWALIQLVFFHLMNAFLWDIGTLPWFMLAATSIIFAPDWPKHLLAGRANIKKSVTREAEVHTPNNQRPQTLVVAAVGAYLVFQLLMPLRQFLYPGNTAWTSLGQTFAWRMMLVDRSDAVRARGDVPGQGTIGYVQMNEYLAN